MPLSICLHHDSSVGPGARALVHGGLAMQRMLLDICGQVHTAALHGQPARHARAAMQAPLADAPTTSANPQVLTPSFTVKAHELCLSRVNPPPAPHHRCERG